MKEEPSTMTSPTHDPFLEEAQRHGWAIPQDHNYIRDDCRNNVDECPRCAELIEAYDAALMSAFWEGTGPFA